IAHFHTAGVPGRHELDVTQELNYRAIAAGFADLGFTGFLAHEFIPTREPAVALREAIEACTAGGLECRGGIVLRCLPCCRSPVRPAMRVARPASCGTAPAS